MKSIPTRRRCLVSILAYLLVAIVAIVIAPICGSEKLDAGIIYDDLQTQGPWHGDTQIFIDQRIPRVLLGFFVGGAMAVVGAVFQVVLRNPLATPDTLGITSGSAVGAVLAISWSGLAFGIGPFSSVQLLALVGSFITLGLIFFLVGRPGGIAMNTLLLAGVTIGIIAGAFIPLIKYLTNPHMLVAVDRWLIGGLSVVGYRELAALFPLLLPALGLLMMQMPTLNHLALGDEMAMGHGVDVASTQRISLFVGGLATATCVSLTGPIMFIGLIVPHTVRRISGFDHRVVLPASFLLGGAMLIACDTIGRTIIAPTEIPTGIITAIVGGPFFIYILIRK